MKGFNAFLIYGQIIGFVSAIFMAFVFYNESLLGRGVLYIEPNRSLAAVELVMTVAGIFLAGFTMVALIFGMKSDSKVDMDDTMPAPSENPDRRLWV